MAVSQSVARPVRTGTQLGAAEVIVQVVEAFFVDLNEAQHVALLAALTLATGILQVMVENGLGKGFLRQVPGPEVDVVEEGPNTGIPSVDDDPRVVDPTKIRSGLMATPRDSKGRFKGKRH